MIQHYHYLVEYIFPNINQLFNVYIYLEFLPLIHIAENVINIQISCEKKLSAKSAALVRQKKNINEFLNYVT